MLQTSIGFKFYPRCDFSTTLKSIIINTNRENLDKIANFPNG